MPIGPGVLTWAAVSGGITSEQALLEAAQGGDESAFADLFEPYRGELTAHCYRMLGSHHDAEDTMQEVMLRAWRALPRFEGRSKLRSWLYTIATNTSLNAIERRPKRVHPVDYGPRPQADGDGPPGMPLAESVWIEPLPDETLGLEDFEPGPEAQLEQRESIELAFVAALQLLPPNQRAALILREVLGYSAKEVAATLETSVPSVNSALQRARATIDKRLPERSQQAVARELGEDGVREVIDAYVAAWDKQDIDGVVSMLTEEATFSMPPLATWYGGEGGPPELEAFMKVGPLSGEWDWRHVEVTANGQPALAFYAWHPDEGAYLPFALNVLSIDPEQRKVFDVTCFICRSTASEDPDSYVHFPYEPVDPTAFDRFFGRFGLPERLEK
jgi:RNA polymerase sigma-70 factor, ECF subfamily